MPHDERVAAQLTPVQPLSPVAGLTIRAALVLGFGLTLGLWLWAGYRLTDRMGQLEAQTTAINARYLGAQELLSSVRAQVLLSSVEVRDALLDPDPAARPNYLERYEDAHALADRALGQYVPILDSEDERARVATLQREIDGYHAAMQAVFHPPQARRMRSPIVVLREDVVPKRDLILRVSDQVQSLNRSAYIDQRAQTTALYRDAERRAWQRLGLALGASLTIALLATLYAGRLEARVGRQRVRDLQLTSDLHRLSARLATVQEDERRTIARELHDEVGQALTAIKVQLSLAQRGMDAGSPVAGRLDDARRMTEDTLQTTRNLSHLLHPPLLDDLGLPAALKNYLEGFSRRHGVRAELLHEHMGARLPPELETALYRIVQEALTNVAKHAHARTCRVFLQGLTSTVLVTIEDDGTGFDPVQLDKIATAKGLGLISIRERVAQLGGSFELETAPGQGTRLTIEMPARRRASETAADFPAPRDGSEASIDGETANLPG